MWSFGIELYLLQLLLSVDILPIESAAISFLIHKMMQFITLVHANNKEYKGIKLDAKSL